MRCSTRQVSACFPSFRVAFSVRAKATVVRVEVIKQKVVLEHEYPVSAV